MKKLLSVLLLLVLLGAQGCTTVKAIIGSFGTPHFDGSEYSMATHLRATIAEDSGKCSDPTSMKSTSVEINSQAFELYLYAAGMKGNDDVTAMLKELQQMTGEMEKRYASVNTVSEAYCDHKMQILLRTAGTVQRVIGAEPK